MIEVDHLTKRYGSLTAVRDISFQVERGEIVGFLGPNGAGKTTTMRILTGYQPATSGSARVAGFDIFDSPMEVKRRIGYLPEHPPLYRDMRVRTFLYFVSRIKGVPRAEREDRIDQVMEWCGIADRGNQLIGQLSKGYQQRVGLAQAIVHNPDVIILDEPTIGLDPNQIRDVRQLIRSLGEDHTVILSTHILPEVEMTCDRVVIINKGEIVAVDTPENLRDSMKGGERVYVEVCGDPEAAEAAIRRVPDVADVSVVGGKENAGPSLSLHVEAASRGDIRPRLAAALVGAGFELLELRRVDLTLEDIFHELTTTEAGEA